MTAKRKRGDQDEKMKANTGSLNGSTVKGEAGDERSSTTENLPQVRQDHSARKLVEMSGRKDA